MRKIVKLSVIRENEERSCPYGLPIIEACQSVGDAINEMCPIEEAESDEEKDMVMKANSRIFTFSKQSDEKIGQCKYANVVFDNEKVECNFGDYAAGMGTTPLNPGPMVNTYLDLGFFSVPSNSDYKEFNHYFFAQEKNKTKKDGNSD